MKDQTLQEQTSLKESPQERMDTVDSPSRDVSQQKITAAEIYDTSVLLANHITAQWMAYMVVYANPGDEAFTSLEIDLGLTETEYGLLTGVTFALVSGVFALASGFLVDRLPRKAILIVAGVLWAGLTFAQSYATNFVTILIPRVLMEISITA